MKRLKRLFAVSVVLAALAALGAGIYFRIAGEGEAAAEAAPPEDRPTTSALQQFPSEIANPVEGAKVVRDTLVLYVSAAGQASSFQATRVMAEVQGTILRLPVKENDRVRAGDVVLAIDPTELEIALERARLSYEQAEQRYRELTILEDRIDDPEVREQRARSFRASSGLDQAELNLREAERNLEKAQVRAPFDGVVANINVVPGQRVRGGEEILTVLSMDPMRVDVNVLEGEIAHISPGRGARIEFSAFPGERFHGTIYTINPVIDSETRTARVTVSVPNPDGRIKAGMYARVALEGRRYPDRVLVPKSALLERDRSPVVFVYQGDERGGVAMWRYVRRGLENDEFVEILHFPGEDRSDPLEPGETVLTAGHASLVHQSPVRLVESVREAGGRPR